MSPERKQLFEYLGELRESTVISFITGDRPLLETQIHPEVFDMFVDHFDQLGKVNKLSLFLYTRGGSTIAAWSIVNLLRMFCDELEIIVPSKAHSAGTLMCLGANRILMTKQATLGPIDPSLTTPLNPGIPGASPDAKYAVSVEAINGYLDLAKEIHKIDGSFDLTSAFNKLSENVHPLVLGEVYRSKAQIKMLAKRLIGHQLSDRKKIEKIINFLCSESGSHDYTINRREARDELGLVIERPDDNLYKVIKDIYDNISNELELTVRFDANAFIGTAQSRNYSLRRCLIESIKGGTHYFVSEGCLSRTHSPMGPQIQDNRNFEGWKYERPQPTH